MSPKELPKLLLDALACPKCRGGLVYARKESRLICNRCMLAYRIQGGIPVMLIEEAEKIR